MYGYLPPLRFPMSHPSVTYMECALFWIGDNLSPEPYSRRVPQYAPRDPGRTFTKYLEYRHNAPALNNAKRTGYLSYAPTLDTIYTVYHGP